LNWYAVIQPGLEGALAEELRAFGLSPTVEAGGARFTATLAEGARVTTSARTPTRVLCEVAAGPARSAEALSALVRKADWRPFLRPDAKLEVAATAQGSRLRFRESVGRIVERAVRDALRGPRHADRDGRARSVQSLRVRVHDDHAIVSIDAGGEMLHVRGWRRDAVAAPLRENIAAALLIASGWNGVDALVDPFCGSGTLPIEAALLASKRAPFDRRDFACLEWPGLRGWRPSRPSGRRVDVAIVGADRDGQAVAAAEANGRRAGVDVAWRRCDIADLEAPGPTGLVIANPPYGRRLGSADGTLTTFGHVLRERFQGWRVCFLAADPGAARRVDRGVEHLATFSNGGLKVGAWGFAL